MVTYVMMIGECLHKCKKRLLLVHGYVITTYGGSEVIIETEIFTPQKNNLPPPTPAVFVRRNALLVCD